MKITGELLKAERIKKNLSIQDVAFALKLSSKIISSLEAGDVEQLPAKTFIRGFVKSYSQYLKLDTEQVLRQFQEEMGSTHPMPKTPPPASISSTTSAGAEKNAPQEVVKKINAETNTKSLVYIGIACVLVLIIVGVNKLVERYQKESILVQADISKTQQFADTNSGSIKNTAQVNAMTTSSGDVTIQNTEQPINQINKPYSAPVETVESTQTKLKLPITQTIKPTDPRQAVIEHKDDSTTDAGFEPSSGKPVELIIEAKKDIEISYAKGNSKLFSKIKLNAKQIQVIRSATGLHLKSDDGGAIHIMVNGIDKGSAGINNKPIRLTF